MLPILSLLLLSPLRCSTLHTLGDLGAHQSNFLVPPQSPRISGARYQPNQAITSDSCKGIIPWTCVCQPEVSDTLGGMGTLPVESVTCSNSRLTDTDVLLSLQTFPNVQYATFYGNNFVEFTDRILGREKHKSLLYLNLSNNNLLYLNQDAFVGMPSLQSLDLSENALYLRDGTNDWAFLRPLRFLRRLLLRRAFRRPLVNASAQLSQLERGLRQARLRDLQFLDLSENDFDYFPPSLVCSTPGLTHLILASNRLRTLHLDKRCPIELKALDLRWNRIKYFDYAFTRAAQFFGPISVQVADNPFDCSCSNCDSLFSITWFRSTSVIKDKETVRCQAADAGPEADDSDYKSDNFLLYAPLRHGLYCPARPASASNERDTSTEQYHDDNDRPNPKPAAVPKEKPPPKKEPTADADTASLAVTLLTMDADNDTLANNSALALVPFRYWTGNIIKAPPFANGHLYIDTGLTAAVTRVVIILVEMGPVLELCASVLFMTLLHNVVLLRT